MTALDYIVRAQRCREKAASAKNPTVGKAWKEMAEIYEKLAQNVGIYHRLENNIRQ